jgi:hypothetical protein
MKRFAYILLCFCFFGYAQKRVLFFSVTDNTTNKPIENVQIKILSGNQNVITNSEGNAKVEIAKPTRIEFSHLNYKTLFVNTRNETSDSLKIVMQDNSQEIEDIVITSTHPQNILRKLVEKSKSQLSVPVNLKVYTREFFKYDGKYAMYNDGLLNFCLKGEKSLETIDILVEQNRKYSLLNNESVEKKTLGYDLNDIMFKYYNFSFLNTFLPKESKKIFNYEVKTVKGHENLNYMVITPNELNDKFLPQVKILYDYKKRTILEVDYSISPERAEFAKTQKIESAAKGIIYMNNFKMVYKKEGEMYYLINAKEEIGFISKMSESKYKNIEVTNYLVTTKCSKNFVPHTKEDVFKDKTLINKKNSIITNFWDISSGLLLTNEEQKIVKSLEEEQVANKN